MEIRDTVQSMMDASWDLPIPVMAQGRPKLLTPEDEAYIRNYPEKTQLGVGENKGYPDLLDLEYMAIFDRMKRNCDQGFVSDAIADGVDLVTKYPTWPRGLIRLAYAYTAANDETYRLVAKQLLDRARSIVEASIANKLPESLAAPTAHPANDTDLQKVLQSIHLNIGDYWVWKEDYNQALASFDSGIAIDQPDYQIPLGIYKSCALLKLGRVDEARVLYADVSRRDGAESISKYAVHLYPELRLLQAGGSQ